MSEPAPGRPRDSLASIWSRRALTLPLYLALAALYLAGAPLWLLLAGAADLVDHRVRRWSRSRALAFFGLYLGCEVAGVGVAAAIWLATLGGRVGGEARWLEANAALQRAWSSALFWGSARLFQVKVRVEGLELARSGPLLVFVRHASTADTVLAAALVANPNRLLLRYVLKRELLWDPCLDLVGRRLPNAFVDRTGSRSQAEIDAIARLALSLDARSGVLIYPEGTRFTPEKLARGVEALRARKQEQLASIAAGFRNVLPPRLGGPLALLEAAPGVDLIFLEHTGFEGAGSFARFWSGGLVGQHLRVRVRRFAAASIPTSGRDVWLFERWAEMDEWISGVHDVAEPPS